MAEPTPEELAILEREREAFVTGNRAAWLACTDPAFVAELLPDWPGPSRAEGAEAAWDAYTEFFAQFEDANYEYVSIEKHGTLTICDIRSYLVGLGSGAPGELLWTLVVEFDSEARRHTRARWFHTRDEAVAWISALGDTADHDR